MNVDYVGDSIEPILTSAPTSNLLDRSGEFLSQLQALIEERDVELQRVAARRKERLASAESVHSRAREALESWLESEDRESRQEHESTRASAIERFERESTEIEAARAELQARVDEEYEAAVAEAKRKFEEDLWECEALSHAHANEVTKLLDQFNRKVDGLVDQIQRDQSEAQMLLQKWKQPAPAVPPAPPPNVPGNLVAHLHQRAAFVAEHRQALAGLTLPYMAANSAWLFGYILLAGAAVAAVVVMEVERAIQIGVGVGAAVFGILGTILVLTGAKSGIASLYVPLIQAAQEGNALAVVAKEAMEKRMEAKLAAVAKKQEKAKRKVRQKFDAATVEAGRKRDEQVNGPIAEHTARLSALANERDATLRSADERFESRQSAMNQRRDRELPAIEERYTRQLERIERSWMAERQAVAEDWRKGLRRLKAAAETILQESAGRAASEGDDDQASLATQIPSVVRFGQFNVDLANYPGGAFPDGAGDGETSATFTLPALVPFPARPSLLFKAKGEGRRASIDAMQAIMLRLLEELPPDKCRFTILDPVGLGDNFAAFMHLADYNEAMISSRIWTEPRHIDQQLEDLSEHIENVIQQYLRNEYDDIEQYNRRAGSIAEPYRFLVIANFPANFTEAAQRRLATIINSGPRCGVYTLIMIDRQLPQPAGAYLRDLEANSASLTWQNGRFVWEDERYGAFPLTLDAPPPADELTQRLHRVGRRAAHAGRVEVAFDVIAPDAEEIWTASAQHGIDAPLGLSGATRKQALRLGKGTSQHVLIAGKTGSGKSSLLHALIINVAMTYSPDEVELYLVDFKQGVEFKDYAVYRLPHARVVAIESDREFGVSVLNGLDAELKRRADLFREAGVQDLPAFRQANPDQRMPRIMLVVDEFQEFFVEDDKISQDAALLLDRLVRQGRAFGIHVLLGSQTLSGAYTLARSTMGQIAVRIALQCSEADAHLILSEDNTAARLLSRPGEAIYNDANGMIEGNQRFQIAWLDEQRREDILQGLRALDECHQRNAPPIVVFEGTALAEPSRNDALMALVKRESTEPPAPTVADAWLGDPVEIKAPTSAVFRRQSGANLLIVGQNETLVLGMLSAAIVGLLARRDKHDDGPSIYLLNGAAAGSAEGELLQSLAALAPSSVKMISPREAPGAIAEAAANVDRRAASGGAKAPPKFVVIYGVQKFRDLRRSDDDFGFTRFGEEKAPSPAAQLTSVLHDGPGVGVHTIVWCDNVNNLNRTWDRQTLREFDMRIALQMSSNDSSSFIDSPVAGKLGMHRALLVDEERGAIEKFRPYNWPTAEWLSFVAQQLAAEQA